MRIEHLAFNVSEPTKMAEWYTKNLNLRVLRRSKNETQAHFLCDEAGSVVLELFRQVKAPIPNYAAMDPMTLHVAFLAGDVETERRRLIEAGATPVGDTTTNEDGDQLAMVRDPWGLAVQLVKRAKSLE